MSNDQTLRDTFAAAAMAVLDEIDRALRERARNGAPDAREQANTNSADFSNTLRNGAPAGRETVQPVLWMVENSHGVVVDLFDNAANAQRETDRLNIERLRSDYHAVPLYRDPPAPTLTEAELRGALDNAAQWLVAIQSADDPRAGECAATLRSLLARLGGDK